MSADRRNETPAGPAVEGAALRVGAVLLAAGAGSRLGGRPKCLLQHQGQTLIRRTLAALHDAGVADTVVVLGHHAAQIEPALAGCAVARAWNPQPDAGAVSSQRIGLAALPGRPDAVVMALCDQPLIEARHIVALIATFRARPAGRSVVFPQVDGQPGNPVIFSAAVRKQILAGDARTGCRQWRDAHPEAVAPFVTAERAYHFDIDTPADLRRFERETGQALQWPAGDTQAPATHGQADPAARRSGQRGTCLQRGGIT